MKPAPFEYCRPETLDEAVALLAEFGDDALVMAGGLSLGALLNMRMVRPEAVIDINGLSGLDTIEVVGDEVRTGALARQADALASPICKEALPLLIAGLGHVGHYQTRSRGTLCGSVAHADPSAETALCLATLGGDVELTSARGVRRMPVDVEQPVLFGPGLVGHGILQALWHGIGMIHHPVMLVVHVVTGVHLLIGMHVMRHVRIVMHLCVVLHGTVRHAVVLGHGRHRCRHRRDQRDGCRR